MSDVVHDRGTEEAEDPLEHQPSEITYDEHLYPGRPRRLRPYVRRALRGDQSEPLGEPTAENEQYVSWLVNQSMLWDAKQLAIQLSGQSSMWQNPFAHPDPCAAVDRASVWFTGYPLSFVRRPGESYLAGLADPELWKFFNVIGIDAVHTGPVKLAGGLSGWQQTPSVDGHFDRISMQVDSQFGTEDEFRRLCATAAEFGGTIIDDIVPGHTGKGADFRLAELAYGDYPGIYHMLAIPEEQWELLPDVPPGRDSVNLDPETEARLECEGCIVGRLQRVIFYEPGVKETNWSVTRPVRGMDGVTRRWAYLHYFKDGQPSINWLDPSFAGMRLVIGDALHALADLGVGGLRLDANGFLGVEKSAEGLPAWSEGHPLSEAANHLIASMVRKAGGFSFQELNLSIDDIKTLSESGADLSYDFVTRPAYHHALVTGDTEFLRLTLTIARELRIVPASLIHALQNHDELTHELVHFSTVHKDDHFSFRGGEMTGSELGQLVRDELCDVLTGPRAPYNQPFTTNGIASTTASVIAAALGLRSLDDIGPEQIEEIKAVHLLLAKFNAWQPGVFALSGWDLTGMLTLDRPLVADLIGDGDTRWINRGSHDLRGVIAHGASQRHGQMPLGRSLYGNLHEQLRDPNSFACGLREVIDIRRRSGVPTAAQKDIPLVPNKAMLVLVHEVSDGRQQVTALNFGRADLRGTIISESLTPAASVVDMQRDEEVAAVDDLHSFSIELGPYEGKSLLVTAEGARGVGAARRDYAPTAQGRRV